MTAITQNDRAFFKNLIREHLRVMGREALDKLYMEALNEATRPAASFSDLPDDVIRNLKLSPKSRAGLRRTNKTMNQLLSDPIEERKRIEEGEITFTNYKKYALTPSASPAEVTKMALYLVDKIKVTDDIQRKLLLQLLLYRYLAECIRKYKGATVIEADVARPLVLHCIVSNNDFVKTLRAVQNLEWGSDAEHAYTVARDILNLGIELVGALRMSRTDYYMKARDDFKEYRGTDWAFQGTKPFDLLV